MEWLSRNEKVMAKGVSPAMATLMTFTGLQPLESDKSRLYHNVVDNRKTQMKDAEDIFMREYQRGIRAGNQAVPDYEAMNTHLKNADIALIQKKYPLEERPTLKSRAAASVRDSLPAQERWQVYFNEKYAPLGREAEGYQTGGALEEQIRKGGIQ
jgi:hypothetical protein